MNLMTQEALDPVSRMPEFKVCAAQLSQEENDFDREEKKKGSFATDEHR